MIMKVGEGELGGKGVGGFLCCRLHPMKPGPAREGSKGKAGQGFPSLTNEPCAASNLTSRADLRSYLPALRPNSQGMTQ